MQVTVFDASDLKETLEDAVNGLAHGTGTPAYENAVNLINSVIDDLSEQGCSKR